MDRRSGLFGSLKTKLTGGNKDKADKDSSRSSSWKTSSSRGSVSSPITSPISSAPATRRPGSTNPFSDNHQSTDAPPAYTTNPAIPSASSPLSPNQPSNMMAAPLANTADDPYAFLSSFDTVFLIDDSGSMAGRAWRETAAALEAITPICTAHDADGIDVYFLNHRDEPFCHNVTSAGTIQEIFQTVRPSGGTPTGQRLNKLLKPYIAKYQANPDGTKPLNIIVITDGVPSDDVESVIISAAKKLDKMDAPAWQVGIQFFQVGNEAGAAEHLSQLDDSLREIAGDDDIRDMVDTVPFADNSGRQLNADGILKVVLGAVNRRLDRKTVISRSDS